MRKIIFQVWLSMDGYAADSDNSTRFFESGALNQYSDDDLLKFMDRVDTILLGANTYKLFVGFWPEVGVDTEVIANRLNGTPKIVFSGSLQKAPWGKWPEAQVISEDAVKAVSELKEKKGKDMVLWGSISLAQSFMNAGLIDEYHIRVVPAVLGSGRRLFEVVRPMDFDLYFSKQYPGGLMLLEYKPRWA
jgi:dihydrofolate reductase